MFDLSDSNFEDILNATDVSLEDEIVYSGPEIQDVQPQTVNDAWSDNATATSKWPANVAAFPLNIFLDLWTRLGNQVTSTVIFLDTSWTW